MSAHLFIIHFPVAFILLALVAEVAGVGLRDAALRDWGWRLLLLGALTGFLAFATGDGAHMAAIGTGQLDPERLERHELWGSVGVWGLAGAALLRTLWRHRSEPLYVTVNLLLLAGAASVTVVITILGTLVRHGS